MAEQATILIPDISGFTGFTSTTEIDHSAHIIAELLELIVESNETGFTLAEIEGDRLVLGFQLASVQRDSINDVLQLADLLLKMEQKSPQPVLRKQVEELVGHVFPRLQVGIRGLRGEIDRIRALRSETKAYQRYSIELNVAKYTARLDESNSLSNPQKT